MFGFPLAVRPAVHLSPFAIRRKVSGGWWGGGCRRGKAGTCRGEEEEEGQFEEQREEKSFQTHAGRKLFSVGGEQEGLSSPAHSELFLWDGASALIVT